VTLINPFVFAAPFAPTDIAGLQSWLKADALALSDGDPISTWTDASPTPVSPTASGSARPTYKTNVVNGKPVARFDGADDTMSFASNPLAGAAAGTLLVVHKIDADPPTANERAGAPLRSWGSDSAGDHWPFTDGTIYAGWGSTVRKTIGNPAATMTSFRIYAIVTAASDFRFYIDGGAAFFSTATNTVGWGASPNLGGTVAGGLLDGDIAEIVAYDSALSLTDINQVGGYLSTKYAVTWTTAT
jgi:hypothetical protein